MSSRSGIWRRASADEDEHEIVGRMERSLYGDEEVDEGREHPWPLVDSSDIQEVGPGSEPVYTGAEPAPDRRRRPRRRLPTTSRRAGRCGNRARDENRSPRESMSANASGAWNTSSNKERRKGGSSCTVGCNTRGTRSSQTCRAGGPRRPVEIREAESRKSNRRAVGASSHVHEESGDHGALLSHPLAAVGTRGREARARTTMRRFSSLKPRVVARGRRPGNRCTTTPPDRGSARLVGVGPVDVTTAAHVVATST